jgi:hypothetical protein
MLPADIALQTSPVHHQFAKRFGALQGEFGQRCQNHRISKRHE